MPAEHFETAVATAKRLRRWVDVSKSHIATRPERRARGTQYAPRYAPDRPAGMVRPRSERRTSGGAEIDENRSEIVAKLRRYLPITSACWTRGFQHWRGLAACLVAVPLRTYCCETPGRSSAKNSVHRAGGSLRGGFGASRQ